MQTFFDGILASISRFDLIDALDILLVAVMIYYLLKLASRSRAMQVLKGIGLVFIASRLTELFRLQAVTWIFNYLINAGALVLIVLFQPEIRRGLEQIGRGKFLDPLQNHEGMETSGELIRAMLNMSKQHVGALIAIQRKVALGDIIETGTQINGRVSAPLIETIFKTGTALHDGAMIIDGDTILAASCFLPLTSRQESATGAGDPPSGRHRPIRNFRCGGVHRFGGNGADLRCGGGAADPQPICGRHPPAVFSVGMKTRMARKETAFLPR